MADRQQDFNACDECARLRLLLEKETALRLAWENSHEDRDIARHEDIDRRLEVMNHLREQIATERGYYIHRDLYEREHKGLVDRVGKLETISSKVAGSVWAIGAMISAVVAVVTIAIDLIFRFAK